MPKNALTVTTANSPQRSVNASRDKYHVCRSLFNRDFILKFVAVSDSDSVWLELSCSHDDSTGTVCHSVSQCPQCVTVSTVCRSVRTPL